MVSVCMATYNGERFLREQIDSILIQLASDDELIVSDDGSTDATLQILEEYRQKDYRVKLYFNHGEHGFSRNFENAFDHANGDFIFISDQDDIWHPQKYRIMLKNLANNFLVHHDSVLIDAEGNIIQDSLYKYCNNGIGVIKNMYKSTFYGSHMALSKDFLDICRPFPTTTEIGYDVWMGLVGSILYRKNGGVKFINDKLISYRRHNAAFCGNLRSSRPLYRKAYGRLLMIKNIISFETRISFKNIIVQ